MLLNPQQLANFNPSLAISLFEDFLSGDGANGTVTATLAFPYFARYVNGAGGFVVQSTGGVPPGNTGWARIRCGPTANFAAGIFPHGSGENVFFMNNGNYFYEWRAQLATLSTAAEEYIAMMGVLRNSVIAQNPQGQLAFFYDRLNFGVNWQCCARNAGGARTVVNTGVVAITGTPKKFRCNYDSVANAATFLIDGVVVANISGAAIPSATDVGLMAGLIKVAGAGATNNEFYVDYLNFQQTLVTPR